MSSSEVLPTRDKGSLGLWDFGRELLWLAASVLSLSRDRATTSVFTELTNCEVMLEGR